MHIISYRKSNLTVTGLTFSAWRRRDRSSGQTCRSVFLSLSHQDVSLPSTSHNVQRRNLAVRCVDRHRSLSTYGEGDDHATILLCHSKTHKLTHIQL